MVNDVRDMIRATSASIATIPNEEVITNERLVNLNKQLKKKLDTMKRLQIGWERTTEKAFFLEDINSSASPAGWRAARSYIPSKYQALNNYLPVLGIKLPSFVL